MAVGIPIRWADNTAELRAHLKEGVNQIETTRASAEKLAASLSGDRMITAAHKYAAAISEIGGAQKLTTAEATRASAIFDKAIEKYRLMGSAIGPLPDVLRQVAEETKKVAEAEKEAAKQAEAQKKAEQDLKDAAEAHAYAMKQQAKDIAAAAAAAQKRTLDALQGISLGARAAGTALTVGITAPLAAIAYAGINASAPFEASLAKMVSLAGVTKDELAGVKEHILALAPAVGVGPQKLAEAMTIVSSTVSDTSVALQILDVSAKGSAAGLGDAFDVARALTAVINSYGAATIDAARAGDILVQTVKDGGAEAKELAPVLANVVPIAAQLGVSFEEVGANIATVTKLGVPAAEAITQLSSVFSGLLKETAKGREALASIKDEITGVGRTYADLRQEVKEKGLMAALIHLNEQFGEHKEKLTQVFGRIEALRDVMSTAGQQAETYAEVLGHLKNAAGSLDGAFLQMKGTQIQTWNEVRAALDVVAIRFGDALAPSLVKVLEAAKPLLDVVISLTKAFAALPEPVREAVILFGGLVAAVGPLLIGFGAIVGAIRTLLTSYLALEAYFAGATVVEGAVAVEGAAVASGAAVTAFSEALLGFASAAVWPITVITGIGIALYELYQHSTVVRELFDEIASFVESVFIAVWVDLKEAISDCARIVRDVFIIEWQHLRREMHLDLLIEAAKGIRDLAKALTDDLGLSIDKLVTKSPTLRAFVRDLEILASLGAGLHAAADGLDEVASAAQRSLVGAHTIGPGFMSLPRGRSGGLTGGAQTPEEPGLQAGGSTADALIAQVKALTAAERERFAVLKAAQLTDLEIAADMRKSKEVIALYDRQLNALGKTHREVTSQAAKLWAEYAQVVDQAVGDSLGAQLAKIEKWKETELATIENSKGRNKKYYEDLEALEAVYWAKRLAAEKTALEKQREQVEAAGRKQLDDDYARAVAKEERDKEIFAKGQKANLDARKTLNDLIAKMTMTEREQKEREIRQADEDQKFALDQTAVEYRDTYDKITETTRLKLLEIGIIFDATAKDITKRWVYTFDHMWYKGAGAWEQSMLPPGATFAAKKNLQSLSDTIGQVAQAFTQLATISGGSFGNIAKAIGGSLVGFQQLAKVMEDIAKIQLPDSGGFNAKNIAGLATQILGLVTAFYQVAQSLLEASARADQLAIDMERARQIAKVWGSESNFSEDLTKKFQKLADEFTRLGVVANAAAAEGILLMDFIGELGGVSMLTAAQLEHVHQIITGFTVPGGKHAGGLFDTIALGGVKGAQATKALDDVLTALGDNAVKTSGLVDKFFLDQVKHAQELGIELEKVSKFLQEQAQSGEEGILRALKVTDDAYAKRAELKQKLADLTKEGDSKEAQAIAKIIDLEAKRDKVGKDTDKGRAYQDQIDKLVEANQEIYKQIVDTRKEIETQDKIIQVAGLHSQAAADAMAGSLLDIIASQVKAGKSFGDAIRAVAPGIEALEKQMAEAGLSGSDAFKFLKVEVALFNDEVAGPALTAIEGYAQGLRGLHNAGLLNQDTFAGISSQIGATRDALVAQGFDGKNVLIAMQGPLQTLWELEKKFGYTTDEATQKLIDQAEEQGLVGEEMKPVQEQMLDATLEIRDAVKELVKALGGVADAGKDAADGLTDHFGRITIQPINVPYTYTPTNTPGAPQGAATGGVVTTTGVQHFATGGPVLDDAWRQLLTGFTTGTDTVPIMATPGEGILSVEGMDSLGWLALKMLNQGIPQGNFSYGSLKSSADPTFYSALDGVKTIIESTPQDWADKVARSGGSTTVTSGGGGAEIHYHDWQIAISALDTTDLQHKVEHEILPMVIAELEDNRRGATRRMSNALRRSQ